MTSFNDYQSMEQGDKSGPGKPMRSIPDRVADYRLPDLLDLHSKVLDIGCNRGYFGAYLSSLIKEYWGIDPDGVQIGIGNQEIVSRGIKNCHLVEGEFTQHSFEGQRFDAIFSFAVHCYVGIPMRDYCDTLLSLLKPDGYLFLEGHPKGYEGEPERYQEPLLKNLDRWFELVGHDVVQDRGLSRGFWIYQKKVVRVLDDKRGMVSQSYLLKNNTVEKHYYAEAQYPDRPIREHFMREREAFAMFHGYAFFPFIEDIRGRTFFMSYCGEPICEENRPENWLEQCTKIEAFLTSKGLYHNDLKTQNVLVLDGKIRLIDFGFMGTMRMHPDSNNLVAVVGECGSREEK